jgi:hypothetical protein
MLDTARPSPVSFAIDIPADFSLTAHQRQHFPQIRPVLPQ